MIGAASVVVDNLDFGIAIGPDETDAELIVDANTPLAGPVALERLEATARRTPQVLQSPRQFKLQKLSERRALDVHKARHWAKLE